MGSKGASVQIWLPTGRGVATEPEELPEPAERDLLHLLNPLNLLNL